MKLYTEEQINKSIRFGFTLAMSNNVGLKEYKKEFIDSLSPIELPSDDEIKEASPIVNVNAHDYYFGHLDGFIDGAKWIRDKITNTKEK